MESKRDRFQEITDTLIQALESGNIVWRKPWKGLFPSNAISGKKYRGINPWLLALFGAQYADHRWLTFKQALDAGGNVRRGEKGRTVVFWDFIVKKDENDKIVQKFPLLKAYTVFNVEQCENLSEKKVKPLAEFMKENPDLNPLEEAERIIREFPNAPVIQFGTERACYSPSLDTVTMPRRELFVGNNEYYCTFFHELIHSTGHEKRLDRKFGTNFLGADEDYSKEELVAEFGATMLMTEAGLEPPINNSAAYINGWLMALRNDKKMAVAAAGQAQVAAEYILGNGTNIQNVAEEEAEVLAVA